MAHVGQKSALGPVGLQRLVASQGQFPVGFPQARRCLLYLLFRPFTLRDLALQGLRVLLQLRRITAQAADDQAESDQRRHGERAGQDESPLQTGPGSGDAAIQRAGDLQHTPHVPFLPVGLGAVRVCIMAVDAGGAHPIRNGIAHEGSPLDIFELDKLLLGVFAQEGKGVTLERVARTAVGASPRERVITVQPHVRPVFVLRDAVA